MPTPDSSATPSSCTVVVSTRYRAEQLTTCLASLRRLDPAPLEIIVVDNSAGDASTRATADRFATRYLVAPKGGLCAARNIGAQAATGDVVAFIDDDALAESDWVGALLRGFADPAVGAVTGRIRPMAVETDAHRLALDVGLGVTVFDREAPFVLDRSADYWFAMAAFGGLGNGTNMAIRRSIFDAGVAFHEGTGRGTAVIGYDEHFVFVEIISRGHRIAYRPDAVVRHPLPDTVADLRRQHTRDLAAVGAFATLLFVETGHRASLVKYIWQSLSGSRRSWRIYRAGAPPPRIVSRATAGLALASGPFRYLRGRLGLGTRG